MPLNKIWYRFFKQPFNGTEPRYFDVDNEPWALEILKNFKPIQQEITEFIKHDAGLLKEYRFNISTGKPQWQTFSLQTWGFKHAAHIKKMPATWGVFKNMKGVTSVSISRLVANSAISVHQGDTNAIYRCHVGIKIPAGKPDCCFTVEDEEREWTEGKIIAFCDARMHHARNLTNEDRYVIIFDRIRDEYLDNRYAICSTIIATHFFHAVDIKIGFYKDAPVWMLKALIIVVSPFINFFLRVQDLGS